MCEAAFCMTKCSSRFYSIVFVEYILCNTEVEGNNCFAGTGKSHVIVNLIIQILYAQKQNRKHSSRRNVPRILVCAPSNAAIDELVIRLLHVRRAIQSKYDIFWKLKRIKAGGQTYIFIPYTLLSLCVCFF
jgi:hypothetical protein